MIFCLTWAFRIKYNRLIGSYYVETGSLTNERLLVGKWRVTHMGVPLDWRLNWGTLHHSHLKRAVFLS